MSLQRNCFGCDEQPGHLKFKDSALVTKMFSEVTGLKVDQNIASLCKSCHQELKQCFTFRMRCHEIDELYQHEAAEATEEITLKNEVNIEHGSEEWIDNVDESLPQEYPSILSQKDLTKSSDHSEYLEESISSETFECSICGKVFHKRRTYEYHLKSHENLRNFKCPRDDCSSAFNWLSRLTRHLRCVHNAEENEIKTVQNANQIGKKKENSLQTSRVQCGICEKTLSSVKYLKSHMMLQHLNNAPYSCEVCQKKFIDWSLLEKHQKIHEGLFDFTCKYCDKRFVLRKVYNQHLRKVHKATKEEIAVMKNSDLTCIECNKVFKTSHSMKEHKAWEHGTVDKFICDICGKSFMSRIKLTSHQKYHQEEKMKLCKICPSTFTEEKGLKTHLRRVHKINEINLFEMFLNDDKK
ncbi:CLUMA_CG020524, isoform A [Clunio marinus]|uniref:CLUMA_CG020524, isoform A n=1 Tax=Clunio marinus TaxID=568069 RepID=A0A1J1J592_9DIPT|nr:CLUMA_CG020524, isoform A [Clunio marinus]